MHCPSCGQQQVSNETKFCSRCGMPLTLVSEVVVHGGYLPQLAELEKTSGTIYTRKNGVVFSLFWLIFWLLVMAVVFGGIFRINILGELFSVIGIFGGLLIFLFSLFFLKSAPKYPNLTRSMPQQTPAGLYGQHGQALPPPQSIPASAYAYPAAGSWRDTNDLEPKSVTEDTTRPLIEGELKPETSRRCSACNTSYTDQSLRYCLVDGAALIDPSADQETVVRSTDDISKGSRSGGQRSGQ
jgi:hypothetical protein